MELLLLYITVKTMTLLREKDNLRWKTEKGQKKTLKTGDNIISRSQFACGLGILVAPTFSRIVFSQTIPNEIQRY